MWYVVLPFCVGIVGFIIAIATMNTAARYVSLCVEHAHIAFLQHLGSQHQHKLVDNKDVYSQVLISVDDPSRIAR